MKKKLLTILSIFITFMIISSLLVNTYAVSQADKDELQGKIDNAKNELNQISSNKSNAEDELESLTNQVTEVQNELSSLKAQLAELNNSIDEKQAEITDKEEEIKRKDDLLKQRMVALYELGDTSYLDVLLSSSSIIEFLSNYSMIQQIVETDTALIDELESIKNSLEEDKAALENDKLRVEELKVAQEVKSAQLKTLQDKKQSEVNKLSEEQKLKQSEIDSYNAAMVKVNEALEEAFRKAQEEMNKNNGSSPSSGAAGNQFDGSFIWPCNNKYVTSTVKRRWGRMHKGIDIGASYESVYASASGYAYNAYDRNGYGTYIMIFHGSGYVSLYGHLSSSHVYDGQYVKQGQVIATSGNSGASQGAHLHFELRQATSVSQFFSRAPLNPLNYLPGGYTLAPGATTES